MREETFTIDWAIRDGRWKSRGSLVEEPSIPRCWTRLFSSRRAGRDIHRARRRTGDYPDRSGLLVRVRRVSCGADLSLVRSPGARRGGAALYTADRRAFENDRIFMEFLTEEHDAFVIEDADHILASRSNGNLDMHRFLAIADGVVRAQGRKILFTTNLPNVGDIDEALLRPGRCFANVRTRPLSRSEAMNLVNRICGGEGELFDCVMEKLLRTGAPSATLAAIYQYLPANLR